ncbi:MAG: PQQ-binding-like beta-propeller repeat protein [Verrucomicrobia bacterium]|nr:PQQ-binding-like beta-propeller repeat protein [Verrucomicrobiota bacterium]
MQMVMGGQTSGQTSEWLHCRGPAYDGHTPAGGVHLPWPAQGPRLLWRKSIGEGYSGLVVSGTRVYSQIQTLGGQYLICLDLKTGEEKWRTRYNWPWQPDSDWPGPFGTPTLANGRVYFTDCFGLVLCADAVSGHRVWSVNLAAQFGIDPPAFGYAITPLVHDGKVIVPVGGKGHAVVAFRADNGAVAWQTGDEPANYSSCILASVGGTPQVVAYLENSASGLDPLTGRELWRYSWGEQYGPHGTWPLYQEPFLFYGLPFRCGGHALDLSRTREGVGAKVAWTNNVLSMDMLSGVIVDGFIYGFDVRDFQTTTNRPTRGFFKCVELATGRQQWASPMPGHASVLAWGNRLLLLNETGLLIAAEANPAAYQELARAPIFPKQPCWTAPSLCGDLLVARSHREFVCLYLGDPGREIVSASTGTLTAPSSRPHAEGWFARHRGPVYYMPGLRIQWNWFLACLLSVFVPAALLTVVVSKDISRRRVVYYVTGFVLSLCGTWGLTEALGSFVFTWPAGIFLALVLALEVRAWVSTHPGRLARAAARIALAALVAGLMGYWWLCRSLFLVVGQGYLTGLLPAIPFAIWTVRLTRRRDSWLVVCGMGLLSFSVFFWTSAGVLWWRTR